MIPLLWVDLTARQGLVFWAKKGKPRLKMLQLQNQLAFPPATKYPRMYQFWNFLTFERRVSHVISYTANARCPSKPLPVVWPRISASNF
jgi:hypothetical protein